MNAAVQAAPTIAPAAAPQPAMTLDDLHKAVQRRIGWDLNHNHSDDGYHPLVARLHAARNGMTPWGAQSLQPQADLAAFEADLRELLDVPVDVLRRMVMQRAVSARCMPPEAEAMLRQVAASTMRQEMQAMSRPRMSPAELVQSLAARGVTLSAGEGGTLRAVPADLLTAADLEVLRTYKPAILDVLAAPAAVV